MEMREQNLLLSGEEYSRQGNNCSKCPKAGRGVGQFQEQKAANCGWSKRWEDYTEPCADERAYTFTLNECPFKNIICPDSFQEHEVVAHHVPSTVI